MSRLHVCPRPRPPSSPCSLLMGSQGSPTGSQESHRGARSTLPPLSGAVYRTAKISSSMLPPTEAAGETAVPVLVSVRKRHCGVGTWSGGRPPGVAGAPGVVIIERIQIHHAINRIHAEVSVTFLFPLLRSADCPGCSKRKALWTSSTTGLRMLSLEPPRLMSA